VESLRADRVFVATGPRVLELDPAGVEKPVTHDFPDALRSVRHVETPAGAFLMGGAKRHVSILKLNDGREVHQFPLPGDRAVKGGVNSIAATGDWIFATHSEHGLVRWRRDQPGEPGELLFEDLTRRHRTTRGVEILDGRLLFASGHHVYLAPIDGAGETVKYVSSIESPVTCLAAAARTLFAGTENGSIACWKIDAPDQPVVLVRKREAIVNLRLARICAIPHLIYSARDLSVRARVIGQNLETSYESEGASVGVLDATSDLIAASDAEGRRVLLWKATAPSRPSSRVDVWKESSKPILDIWLKKVRAKSA
jgi:hypothetical protein